MANVNEMFDDITKEQSFFVPSDKKKKEFKPFAKGDYFCHFISCDSKIVDVAGGKRRARLYTYTVQAAEENKDTTFMYKDITGNMEETKGDCYVGSKFRGKLWRFLEPTEKDTFEAYSEGNETFLKFCDAIGIECKLAKKEINGEQVEVKILPNLEADDILGKPVIAHVDLGRPWTDKEGKKRQYWDAKYVKEWEKGKSIEITGDKDAIPF